MRTGIFAAAPTSPERTISNCSEPSAAEPSLIRSRMPWSTAAFLWNLKVQRTHRSKSSPTTKTSGSKSLRGMEDRNEQRLFTETPSKLIQLRRDDRTNPHSWEKGASCTCQSRGSFVKTSLKDLESQLWHGLAWKKLPQTHQIRFEDIFSLLT